LHQYFQNQYWLGNHDDVTQALIDPPIVPQLATENSTSAAETQPYEDFPHGGYLSEYSSPSQTNQKKKHQKRYPKSFQSLQLLLRYHPGDEDTISLHQVVVQGRGQCVGQTDVGTASYHNNFSILPKQ
jgi:hypothetical protein